jgi:hypothetical protein
MPEWPQVGDVFRGYATAGEQGHETVAQLARARVQRWQDVRRLDQDDPNRQTVMTGSFLRASLFTSVVTFGVAAMAAGLGIVLALIGFALMAVARQLTAGPAPAPA